MQATVQSKVKIARSGFLPRDPELTRALKALTKPSTAASLTAYGLDWLTAVVAAMISGKVFAVFGVSFISVGVYVLAAFYIATRQRGIKNLVHEASHFSLSPNRVLNRVICYSGSVWLKPDVSVDDQRRVHVMGHHRYFGNLERDNVLSGYEITGLSKLPKTSLSETLLVIGRAYLRLYRWKILSLLALKGVRARIGRGVYTDVIIFAVVVVGFVVAPRAALVALSWWSFYWLVPALAILPIIDFLVELSEHAGCLGTSEFDRTRNKLGFIQEYVFHPHGDGYHLLHHLYPGIPHQNLSKAHQLLMTDWVYHGANHVYGFVIPWRGRRTLLQDLLSPRVPTNSY